MLLLEASSDYRNVAALSPEISDRNRPAFTHDWAFASERFDSVMGVDYDYLELTFDAAGKLQVVRRSQG